MAPHCNRCFGYLAMALEMDYWVVPELSCFYHLKYTATELAAEAVANTLKHILRERQLSHLIVNDEL